MTWSKMLGTSDLSCFLKNGVWLFWEDFKTSCNTIRLTASWHLMKALRHFSCSSSHAYTLSLSFSCAPSRTSRRFRSSRSCGMRRRWPSCFSWWSPASCCAGRLMLLCPWWRPLAGRAWSPQPWPSSRRSLPSPAQPTTPSSTCSWAERFVVPTVWKW